MVAVVTGGCHGLGLSFTEYLLSEGYIVYALYNTSKENADVLEKKYNNLTCIKCNIASEEEVKNVISNIKNIDLLINNAGICIDNSYYDKSIDEFMHVIRVNLGGPFLVIKYAMNNLNETATIINISSNNALDNYAPLSMDYDASKAGVNMLTKDFSLILKDNQKIFSICPGWINTEAIREMNPDYLKEEMNRVNQNKLIEPNDLVKNIFDNINNYKNGDIIEIREL